MFKFECPNCHRESEIEEISEIQIATPILEAGEYFEYGAYRIYDDRTPKVIGYICKLCGKYLMDQNAIKISSEKELRQWLKWRKNGNSM